jgi:hypothetical protein
MSEIFLPEASLYSVKAFLRSWIFWSLLLRDLAKSALLAWRSLAIFEDLSWVLRRFSIKLRSSSWVFFAISPNPSWIAQVLHQQFSYHPSNASGLLPVRLPSSRGQDSRIEREQSCV